MPPWNVHDILLRVTNPPYTDANGFLQADHQGVINRWDIINTIEHLPWTTKQLYAMREAKHNSRAKQISAFNGWNNQYSSEPWTYHQYHGIMEEDLWRRHRGHWYHPDGRPLIPIRKNVDRVVNFGGAVLNKCVAQPIGSLLRRTRSFGALPKHDSDTPPPVPEKQLRRRATLAELKKEFRRDLYDQHPRQTDSRNMRCCHGGPCDCSHHQALGGPSRSIPDRHGRYCRCEQCVSCLELLRGNYPPAQPKNWDINKPTGADAYSETWNEWNDRIDFNRDFLGLPLETTDLRHRSRNRDPHRIGVDHAGPSQHRLHTRAVDPKEVRYPRPTDHDEIKPSRSRHVDPEAAFAPRPVRHEQAKPSHTGGPHHRHQSAIPPAPIVPDHVASHYQNARLLNEEQKHWAKERADWKAARLQERRVLDGDPGHRVYGGPVDEWRRTTQVPPQAERSRDRDHVSRPKQPRAPERQDVPGRRHRHEEPTTSKSKQVPAPAAPARTTQAPKPAPPAAKPNARPPVGAQPVDSKRRHQNLAPDQPYEDDDSDPFDERAYHRAHVSHVHRQPKPAADPIPQQKALPPRAPGRMTRAERDARIAYLVSDNRPSTEERDRIRRELAQFANGEVLETKPQVTTRGRSMERTEARQRQPDHRAGGRRNPATEKEVRQTGQLGYSYGPTSSQYDYVVDRLQNFLTTHPIPSSHSPAFPPIRPRLREAPDPMRGPPPVSNVMYVRPPKPARDIGLGRPPAARIEKVLPSLPSFPPLDSSGDTGPSRERDQPSRRAQGTYLQTPPEDPPVRRVRRGAQRTDQTDFSDDDESLDNAPRAGDTGWRDDWARAQLKAKKQELKKVLEEYEEQEAALARRERKKR